MSVKTKKQSIIEACYFTLPALILVMGFIILPILFSLKLSFSDDSGKFNNLQNFINILKDRRIFNFKNLMNGFPFGAFFHNIIWLIIHVPATMIIGLLFAVLTAGKTLFSARILQTSIFIGMVTPMIIGGVLVRNLFSESVGLVSNTFAILNIDFLSGTWVNHPQLALFALIIVHIWLWSGYSLVIYLAGIAAIPNSYYEAALIDGASKVRMFRHITLPLLKPASRVVFIMTVLSDLKTFDIVFASTVGAPGGATSVLALEMYLSSFRFQEYARGATLATLLTLLAFIPIIINVKRSLEK